MIKWLIGIAFSLALVFIARRYVLNPVRCADCNVVIISIDTLRADVLGVYGSQCGVSPLIDKFAEDSIVFERAFSTAPKTAPSHMSIFASVLPSVHRIHNYTSYYKKTSTLPEQVTTLAQQLKSHGYTSVGFHGGGQLNLSALATGFDTFEKADFDEAINWLAFHGAERPFMLFAHRYEMHWPYAEQPACSFPGENNTEYPIERIDNSLRQWGPIANGAPDKTAPDDLPRKEQCQYWKATYQAQLATIDAMVGKLIEELRDQPKETIIVFLSDHGEQFFEHGGLEHGDLHNELTRVPLILKLPGSSSGRRVTQPVSLVDVAPTILDLVGIAKPSEFSGHSMLQWGEINPSPQMVVMEFDERGMVAAIKGDYKLIYRRPHSTNDMVGSFQLYHLGNDFAEQKNLSLDSIPPEQLLELQNAVNNIAVQHTIE